jgi:hypothetical protein
MKYEHIIPRYRSILMLPNETIWDDIQIKYMLPISHPTNKNIIEIKYWYYPINISLFWHHQKEITCLNKLVQEK